MEAIFLATNVKAGTAKKRSLKSKNALQLYSLAAIPAFLVFLFSYVPMFGIIIAFKNYRFDKGIFGSEWVGLDNIKVFLASDDFVTIARNTVLLNLLFMALGVIAAVLLAVVLYEITSRKAVKTYQTILWKKRSMPMFVCAKDFLLPRFQTKWNLFQANWIMFRESTMS